MARQEAAAERAECAAHAEQLAYYVQRIALEQDKVEAELAVSPSPSSEGPTWLDTGCSLSTLPEMGSPDRDELPELPDWFHPMIFDMD